MTTFLETLKSVGGLSHYYALDNATKAQDLVGDIDGKVHGRVRFRADGAHFDGTSWIELPDSPDFSAAGTGTKGITILAFMTVTDWSAGSHNNEYLHWLGKGRSRAHEWVFRTYVDGGGGEAPQRKRRTSFYAFNPQGGLGTGSYAQTGHEKEGEERMMGGSITTRGTGRYPGKTTITVNGVAIDHDPLSSYSTIPEHTNAPVGIGSRGDGTGGLVGVIRRVAFFNRELKAPELAKIYAARTANDTPPEVHADPTVRSVVMRGHVRKIDGVNVERKADQLIVYTSKFGESTGTNQFGTEIVVHDGHVTEIRQGKGDTPMKNGTAVLSGHGTARTWLENAAMVGAAVTLPESIVPVPPEPKPAEPEPEPQVVAPAAHHHPTQSSALRRAAVELRAQANELERLADELDKT